MNKIRSKLFDESAIVDDNGNIEFESGATYTKDELLLLKKCNQDDIKAIHIVKQVFEGDLEYHGAFKGDFVIHPMQKIIVLKDKSGNESRLSSIDSFPVNIGENITMFDGVNKENYEVVNITKDNSQPIPAPQKPAAQIEEQLSLF